MGAVFLKNAAYPRAEASLKRALAMDAHSGETYDSWRQFETTALLFAKF